MKDKKIHVTVTDEKTRNAITYRFDTWDEVVKFAEKNKGKEEKKNEVPTISRA